MVKKPKKVAVTPRYLIINAALLILINAENLTKNNPKALVRNNIPTIAQGRAAFSIPLTAIGLKRLLI